MGKNYNKGEWSEFYALLKILSERKIHEAGKKLEKKDDFFSVLKVIKGEKAERKEYDITDENEIKLIQEQKDVIIIQSSDVKSVVSEVFKRIKLSSGNSFSVREADGILELLHYGKVKASNKEKADVQVVIHDAREIKNRQVGFSIKSRIGSPPTLFNSSQATNFIFDISNMNQEEMRLLNECAPKKLIQRLSENKEMTFYKVSNEVFNKNLRKIDTLMPLLLSEILLLYFKGQGQSISELTEKAAHGNTLKMHELDYDDLKYKVSQLLINIALGMVPKTIWDGYIKADGGYIIVREDGELVCYHIYNFSEFGEYLFNHTKLDTPSTTRHNFGKIYESKDDAFRINLNLQIRFI